MPAQNYPAWLAAIEQAQRFVLFESYIVDDDAVGQAFAAALAARARTGVRVFVVYDWLGSFRSDALWPALRAAGAEVRGFNAPRFASPLGWLARDHRKTIVVDGEVGFVSGLCVSAKWQGDPQRALEPWRDTGVEIARPRGRRTGERVRRRLARLRRAALPPRSPRRRCRPSARMRCGCGSSPARPIPPAPTGST